MQIETLKNNHNPLFSLFFLNGTWFALLSAGNLGFWFVSVSVKIDIFKDQTT